MPKQAQYVFAVKVSQESIRVQGCTNLWFDRLEGLRNGRFTDELEYAIGHVLNVHGFQFDEEIIGFIAEATADCRNDNDIIEDLHFEVEVLRPNSVMSAMVIIDIEDTTFVTIGHWDEEPIENQPAYAFSAAGELVID